MSDLSIVQNFHFGGEIYRKSALDWSGDNRVSVSTSKGIYIFTSYFSPIETGFPLPLHKQVIPTASEYLDYNFFPQLKEKSFDVNCPVPFYETMLDHTLMSPKEPLFLSYKCALWSPRNLNSDGSCVLATLTMDHHLVLYQERDREWEKLSDLSEILYTIRKLAWIKEGSIHPIEDSAADDVNDAVVTINNKDVEKAKSDDDDNESDNSGDYNEEYESNSDGSYKPPTRKNKKHKMAKKVVNKAKKGTKEDNTNSIDLENCETEDEMVFRVNKLKDRAYNLAFMEMAWTNVFSTSAPSSNEMPLKWSYLITAMKSGRLILWKVSPDDSQVVSYTCEWDPGLGLITSLCWQQTSTNSGFLVIGTFMGLLTYTPVNIRVEDGEPKVDIKPLCKLWDESDQMVIDHIVIMKISAKKFIIVAAKQSFIINCEVNLTESDTILKNVGHSVGLHKMPITGMSVRHGALPQTELFLSSLDNLLINVKINITPKAIEFSHEALQLDVDLKHNTIQGLGVSPNGVLCGVILNTSAYYDHHIKKEALQFVMFTTKPMMEILVDFGRVLKPQFSFLPANNICHHTDYLECVRIQLASSEEVPEFFRVFLGWHTETYERLSSIELYFLRFLLKCFLSELALNMEVDKDKLEYKLDVIETVIMQNYMSKVISSCHDKVDLLSPAQGQSLLLMADWLFMQFRMPVCNLYEAFGYECPSDPTSIPARETCRICQLPVKLVDIRFGECEQGHKFGRCCQSLILCDVTPYYQCLSCKSMALEDVWSSKFICTYCSLPMTK